MMARMLDGNALVARRLGRIAFGAVLIAGTAYLVADVATTTRNSFRHYAQPEFHGARIICVTWLVAIAAGFVTSRIAARADRRWHPEHLFAESLMVPTIGIAALGPITLHMGVVLPLLGCRAFDMWVFWSLVVTGIAHVVFAVTSAMRVYELVAGKPARSPRWIYIATVCTSCVPFLVLLAIPPVLVALTALPFVPLLHAMETLVARERRQIAAAMHPLPRATLHLRDAAAR
jgi:hypothetical protein